jgi:NADH:ubiquinone oxidoreductase subunit F (NADH-binding)
VAKYFCLTGDVGRPGGYREPLGIRADALIEKRGGPSGQGLKAFLPGGLSGGLLPASQLDVELNFEAVRKHGCGLGTGAVVAIGKDRCIVDVLSTLADFFRSESCGKCVPCRLGTVKLSGLMDRLRNGKASEADLRDGEVLARVMQETSLCALGQVAGKPLLDAMTYLREEMLAHTRGECPAHVCRPRGG